MATSVKMRDRDKRRLDRLQAELERRYGRRVTQQELLSWLLNLGEAAPEHILEDATRPMSKRELASLRRLVVRTGVPTREEEIDGIVAAEAR